MDRQLDLCVSYRLQLVNELMAAGIRNREVLEIISVLPREHFIDHALSINIYQNSALPIGAGQTISQPYTVAKMSELILQANCRDKVLEVGTGSGYQTAILASLFNQVYSIERIGALHHKAQLPLRELGFDNILYRHGDGWNGWLEFAPYDVIILTAAPAYLPTDLIKQLNPSGGIMVAPVGELNQELTLIRREGAQWHQEVIETARFVPMIQGELA